MSEKVLHAWTDALGDEWRLIAGPRPMGMGFQRRSAESGWEWAPTTPRAVPDLAKALLGLVREVHRLIALRRADLELHEMNAARVAELEAKNAKLRKCVAAADAMRVEARCEHENGTDPRENCCDACWSMIHCDAARAEVDNG